MTRRSPPPDETPLDSGIPRSVGPTSDQRREAAAVEGNWTMSMELSELGRDIETPLGEVVAHFHREAELPR